jgi:hypothetical protein
VLGHRGIFLLKPLEDREGKVAFHADAGFHVADEDMQVEGERAGGHSGKQDFARSKFKCENSLESTHCSTA